MDALSSLESSAFNPSIPIAAGQLSCQRPPMTLKNISRNPAKDRPQISPAGPGIADAEKIGGTA